MTINLTSTLTVHSATRALGYGSTLPSPNLFLVALPHKHCNTSNIPPASLLSPHPPPSLLRRRTGPNQPTNLALFIFNLHTGSVTSAYKLASRALFFLLRAPSRWLWSRWKFPAEYVCRPANPQPHLSDDVFHFGELACSLWENYSRISSAG